MSYKIDHTKGYTGLQNLGNTCFLNSCMQALSHTYELTHFLQSDKYKQHLRTLSDNIIINEWVDLYNVMWSQNGIVSPKRFVHNVQKLAVQKDRELFTGWAQNDLPEFLLFLVECMHNSIARGVKMNIKGTIKNNTDRLATACYQMLKQTYSKEYSEIWNMFYGMHVSELVSIDETSIVSQNPEPFFNISLPIPNEIKSPTLYDCLDKYVKGEILSDDNAWFNEKTGKKQDIIKRIKYWSFPKILCIDLKRIDSSNKKRHTLVDFPIENLSLKKYVVGYNSKSFVYDLYGVCNHHGTAMGGHYTAYIKGKTGRWYEFNDTRITMLQNTEPIVSPKAYCLFYRKKSNV